MHILSRVTLALFCPSRAFLPPSDRGREKVITFCALGALALAGCDRMPTSAPVPGAPSYRIILVPDEDARVTLVDQVEVSQYPVGDDGVSTIREVQIPEGRWQLDIRLEGLVTLTTPSINPFWNMLQAGPFGPAGPVPTGTYPYPWYLATWVYFISSVTGEFEWIYVPPATDRGEETNLYFYGYYTLNDAAMTSGSAFYNAQERGNSSGGSTVGGINWCDAGTVASALPGLVDAHERYHGEAYRRALARELSSALAVLEGVTDADVGTLYDA
jgi:hypothetical protein